MPEWQLRKSGHAVVLCTPAGCAVHADGRSRLLPWTVVAAMLDDPQLDVWTLAPGELSPWDGERLLAGLAVGAPAALAAIAGPWPPRREAVQSLPRSERRWRRTIDLGVLLGDPHAACCRAGLALPDGDPLHLAATLEGLAARQQRQLRVRERLRDAHPWIGDAAWLAGTGLLAELVVLRGLRRDQVRRPVAAGSLPVSTLLRDPQRFRARRPDVAAAMHSILEGTVAWSERGHLTLRPASGWQLEVDGVLLACGVGGLHSTDPAGVVAGPLLDLDVASYYPSLIAGDRIAPPQLPDFPARVGELLHARLLAKRAGDLVTSTALKLVINSLYGQLGNRRSGLFSPPDALRVVLSGQLRLLQLIDGLLSAGGQLVSVNTDGVIVGGAVDAAAQVWEADTGLSLERTPYRRLWRTSVNDYIAQGVHGVVAKTKGRFAGGDDEDATRRAAAPIVARAALEYLVHGHPVAATVAASDAPADFALWRRARDLTWDGIRVTAPVVRWVVGRGGTPIVQVADGRARVTVAARAIPLADPAACNPTAIDRDWYVAEATALIDRVMGTEQGMRQLSLLDD
jgi:hypothetical protein